MGEKVLTREIVEANGWDKLEVITADMLQGYTDVGAIAFLCCPIKEITLPDTIREIDRYAFCGTPLKRITIPETITDIGYYAFGKCNELEEVIFKGEKIEMLGYKCFAYCNNLKKINIPKNCDYIYNVFDGCSNVTSKFEIQDYSKPVVAYKGFRKDMICMNGFQYEEGKTYEFEGEPKLCKCGFHACLNPLEVFSYYPLYEGNVYHEVILESVNKERKDDTKVVAKKITIGREITKEEMIEIFNKKVNLEKENNNNN
jgi:hypothetical protein